MQMLSYFRRSSVRFLFLVALKIFSVQHITASNHIDYEISFSFLQQTI